MDPSVDLEDELQQELAPRHYDTIGIGPVFLAPEGSEVRATIKQSPDDFIVREICKHGATGDLLVADLEKAEEIGAVLCGKRNGATLIADDPLAKRQKRNAAESVDEDEPLKKPEMAALQAKDPLEKLRLALQVVDPDHSFLVSPGGSQASVWERLLQLNRDTSSAIAAIHSKTEKAPKHSSQGKTSVSIRVSELHNTKENRSVVHDAIRLASPLLMSDTACSTSTTNHTTSETMLNVTADFRFFPIIPLLQDPSKDVLDLYRFYRRGCRDSSAAAATSPRISKRHKGTAACQDDSSSCVLQLKPTEHRHDRRLVHSTIATASNGMLSTTTLPENRIAVHWTPRARKKNEKRVKQQDTFTLCIVRKRQCENLVLLHTLARAFRCHVTEIGCAGIKDRQAITYQFCTIPRQVPRRVELHNNITVVPLGVKSEALRKGRLHQNRFEIVLRDVVGTFPPLSGKQRMINFFGTQRVGEPGDPQVMGARTFEIGRAMLKGEFDVVIELMMAGRRVVNGKQVRIDQDDFRQVWKDSDGDAVATYNALTKSTHSMPREQAVLKGLKRYGKDDPLAVIQCLPRNERLFFISAYQSYIWNKMATYRIQRYGDQVCKGDLVYDAEPNGQAIRVVGDDFQQYDLGQVVLPLPGFNIIYPDNEVGERYAQELDADKIKFTKGGVEESTSKGSYRPLIAEAENATLQQELDGPTTNFKLTFDLPTGAYATMLLRELMRTTVAT